MAHSIDATEPGAPHAAPTATAAGEGFFFWMAVLLLALLFMGFAPSFFLRVVFEGTPMPTHLHVHGAVLTSWYVLLVVQTGMVRFRRVADHRKLGIAGVGVAAAVCVAGPLATFNLVPSMLGAGLDWSTDMSAVPKFGIDGMTMEQFAGFVVFGNLTSVVTFALLIVAAVLLRRRSAMHKRLMLIASIVLFPPVLARLSRWPPFGGEDSPFIPVVLLVLLLSVLVYDLVKTRRVNLATVAAILLAFGLGAAGQMLAGSAAGQAFVRSMG